jgi:hypothetical protein
MANRVSISTQFNATLGGTTVQVNPTGVSESLSSGVFVSNLVSIGTTAEAISFGDIGTARWGVFSNDSSGTNHVDLSLNSNGSSPFATLYAGDFAVIPLASTTLYAKSSGAAQNLNVTLVND